MEARIFGKSLVLNHKLINVSAVSVDLSVFDNSIYEVLRIVNSVPVFLEEHFQRLNNSKECLGLQCKFSLDQIKSDIRALIVNLDIVNGNIRIDIRLNNQFCNILVYQVEHFYPSAEHYEKGVILKSYSIERPNPHVKQTSVNYKIRNQIKDLLNDSNVFEVLMVNNLNQVTECSKSNILFVSGNTIISPPVEDILEGITRKRIIKLSEKLNYKVINRIINFNSIQEFDSCFITGTSPKILPVCKIDKFSFNAKHLIISELIQAYDEEINTYCKKFSS